MITALEIEFSQYSHAGVVREMVAYCVYTHSSFRKEGAHTGTLKQQARKEVIKCQEALCVFFIVVQERDASTYPNCRWIVLPACCLTLGFFPLLLQSLARAEHIREKSVGRSSQLIMRNFQFLITDINKYKNLCVEGRLQK